MSNLRRLLLALCTLLSLGVFAQTGEEYAQDAERATRLLDKAVAHYKANGESAFAAFSRQGYSSMANSTSMWWIPAA